MLGTPSLMSLKDAHEMKFSLSISLSPPVVPGEFIMKRSEAVPWLRPPFPSPPGLLILRNFYRRDNNV